MSRLQAIVVATFLVLTSTHVFAADAAAGATQLLPGSAEEMNRMGVRYATGSGRLCRTQGNQRDKLFN